MPAQSWLNASYKSWLPYLESYISYLTIPCKNKHLNIGKQEPSQRKSSRGVPQNVVRKIFCKIHQKTPDSEPLFKVTSYKFIQLYQKETTISLFSCGLYELFYSIFFAKYVCVITSTQWIYDLNWTYVRISNMWKIRRVKSIKVW